jgi:DNA polymerase III subunit delta
MARAARPGPLQAVVGEDTYLAEQALERLLEQAIGDDRQEALTVLYGDETKWEGVVARARTGSLFVTRRAIVVRRADLLKYEKAPGSPEGEETKGKKGKSAREVEDPVVAYLQDPSPEVTLVLMAAKPDRRRNPWKRLLAEATVHSAEPKKGRFLRSYVEEELRRRGLRVAPDALQELLAEVGQDLRRLMGEVEKLEAYTAGRSEITLDDVSAVVGRGLGQPLYRLGDAFAARDVSASLGLVRSLLDDGEEGLRILTTLHRTVRQVRGAVAMREARTPRAEIGARLLPPNMQFKLDALLEASRRWSEEDLRRALETLGRADRRVKRGADTAAMLVAAVAAACLERGPGRATSPRRAR